MSDFPESVTIGDKYHPAMEIRDQEEADAYFEKCVRHSMRWHDRKKAKQIERANLGYFAGYYDSETRERVESLFRCAHPVFGKITVNGKPTVAEAFNAGVRLAAASPPQET